MLTLRCWLSEHGLRVRALASGLDVPLTTVEDWVYRGAMPSATNATKLAEFIRATCTHHWVIAAANGPMSEGLCQRCGEEREFANSAEVAYNGTRPRTTEVSAFKLKES